MADRHDMSMAGPVMSSRRGRELPTQLLVINACYSPEKIRSIQNSAFQLDLRPHFVQIPDFLNSRDNCLTTYASLKDVVEKHITTAIKPINSENSLFLLPKSWFDAINKELFNDFAKNQVCSIGEVTYFDMAGSARDPETSRYGPEFRNPIDSLYGLTKKLHPRYCMILKGFSFIIKLHNHSAITANYHSMVSLIRWMGGLVREETKPGRQNQVLITDAPKGKQYILANTLDIPITTHDSIRKLWEAVDDEDFNSDVESVMETFRTENQIMPFLSSVLHFPSQCFPENELATLEKRCKSLQGNFSDVLEDPTLTHIIVDKKGFTNHEWIEFLENLREIFPNIGSFYNSSRNTNYNSSNSTNLNSTGSNFNNSNVSDGGQKSPFLVKTEWFWESVKAEVKANESDHLIDVNKELRPESALSCDISGSTEKKNLTGFSTKGTMSPVTSQEHLLGRNGPSKFPSRDQLLAESKESQDEPGENSLILPGYGRKAQDLKINSLGKGKSSRQSLQPEMFNKKRHQGVLGEKLESNFKSGISRETPSNLERTFDVVHESRESSFADNNYQVRSTNERIAKAASCSLLDQMANETEYCGAYENNVGYENHDYENSDYNGTNLNETSSPVIRKKSNFLVVSPCSKTECSSRSSREKSLDDLSNSNKRKSCETLDEKKSKNSNLSQSSRDDFISPKPSKIDRKYTILNSPNRSKSEEGLLNVENECHPYALQTHITPTNSHYSQLSPRHNSTTPRSSAQNTPKSAKKGPDVVEKDEYGNFITVSQEEIQRREELKAEKARLEMKENNENCKKEFRMPVLKDPFLQVIAVKSKRYMIIKEFYEVEKNYLANLSFIIREMKMSLEEDYKEKREALKRKYSSVSGEGSVSGYPASELPEEDISVLNHDYTINFEPERNLDTTSISHSVHHTRQPSEASQLFTNQLKELVILPIAEIRALFSKIDKIYTVHCGLLMDLNEFLDNWEENQNNSVGSIMEPYIARFQEVYPPYLNYYNDIHDNFKRCLEEFPKFEAHCKLVESKRKDKNAMKDLMIQPVQRLMRYPLIFQRLMQETQKSCKVSHPDNKCLQDITKLLQGASSKVNEAKRDTENFQKIFSLSTEIERFPPELVSANRKYIYAFDAVHLQRWNANQTKPPKTKRVRLVILSDFIIICHKQRNTFTRKTRWTGKPSKKYLFYKKINIQSISKLLVNETSSLEEGFDSGGRLKSTGTFTDLNALKSSSSFTNLNRTFGTTQGVNHLVGIGFVWPESSSQPDENNDFEFFGINKDGFRNKSDGKLSMSSISGSNDFQGGSMGTLTMPDGSKIKTTAQYISYIKTEIVKIMSTSKGRIYTDTDFIHAVTAQNVFDLHQTQELNQTPYESVSDLSVKSAAWSTCTDEYGNHPNRENRTPSPTSSVASVQSSMGIGFSEHRIRYPSQRSENKMNTSKFGRASLSTRGFVKTLKDSWKTNKLTRNISFSKSPSDGRAGLNKHAGGFLTPIVPGQKKKSMVRNRSATRPEICHMDHPAKHTVPYPIESGYAAKGLPRCQTTSSLTPTRNMNTNPMQQLQQNHVREHQLQQHQLQNQQNYQNGQNNQNQQNTCENRNQTNFNQQSMKQSSSYSSQQVPNSRNIPQNPHYSSNHYPTTANNSNFHQSPREKNQQSGTLQNTKNYSGKTNNNFNSSTPPVNNKSSQGGLQSLTRNHFIASTNTPPAAQIQINVVEPTRSTTLTNSSMSYSPNNTTIVPVNTTLKNTQSTAINSTLV